MRVSRGITGILWHRNPSIHCGSRRTLARRPSGCLGFTVHSPVVNITKSGWRYSTVANTTPSRVSSKVEVAKGDVRPVRGRLHRRQRLRRCIRLDHTMSANSVFLRCLGFRQLLTVDDAGNSSKCYQVSTIFENTFCDNTFKSCLNAEPPRIERNAVAACAFRAGCAESFALASELLQLRLDTASLRKRPIQFLWHIARLHVPTRRQDQHVWIEQTNQRLAGPPLMKNAAPTSKTSAHNG